MICCWQVILMVTDFRDSNLEHHLQFKCFTLVLRFPEFRGYRSQIEKIKFEFIFIVIFSIPIWKFYFIWYCPHVCFFFDTFLYLQQIYHFPYYFDWLCAVKLIMYSLVCFLPCKSQRECKVERSYHITVHVHFLILRLKKV